MGTKLFRGLLAGVWYIVPEIFWRSKLNNKNTQTVPAKNIGQGEFFRKRTGEYVHLKLSDSSTKFLGLDTNYVYGVTHNGNMSKLNPETQVVKTDLWQFLRNIETEREWNNQFARSEVISSD